MPIEVAWLRVRSLFASILPLSRDSRWRYICLHGDPPSRDQGVTRTRLFLFTLLMYDERPLLASFLIKIRRT